MIEEDTEGQILVSIHVHTYKHLHITYKHRERQRDRNITHFGRDGTGRPTHTSSGWPGAMCVIESDPEFLILIFLLLEY